MKYYLEIQPEKTKMAASKAVVDCERILAEKGYQKIRLSNIALHKYHLFDVGFMLDVWKLTKLKKGDMFVVRFPLYLSDRMYMILLYSLKRLNEKGVKLVLLLHDLNSLRFSDEKNIIKYEEQIVNISSYIIAHNSQMAEYINTHFQFPQDRIIPLELFDYLCEKKPKQKEEIFSKRSWRIVIAGNLNRNKSEYIYKISSESNLRYQLYGVNFDQTMKKVNMDYRGAFEPDDLPNVLDGDFGLVWDGTSTNTCEGGTGEYLKYNNPHKCSLYIASELPVIIWDKAALSGFIKENKIGITISSLSEMERKVSRVSLDEYNEMKENIQVLSAKVRTGYYLKKALEKVDQMV